MAILLNLAPVVAAFASQSVTRRRAAVPTIDSAGHAVVATPVDATIECVLQRPSPDAIQRLPEGLRSRATWLMHTTADIRGASGQTSGGRAQAMADQVIYNGITYTVVDISAQTAQGNYRRVVLLDGVA